RADGRIAEHRACTVERTDDRIAAGRAGTDRRIAEHRVCNVECTDDDIADQGARTVERTSDASADRIADRRARTNRTHARSAVSPPLPLPAPAIPRRAPSHDRGSMTKTVIGIDLGTTYSLGAALQAGKPVILPNALGESLTPSAVSLTDDDTVL